MSIGRLRNTCFQALRCFDFNGLNLESGNDLLSRVVSNQVPSALKSLTSVFGMGTGDPFRHCHRKFWQRFCCFCLLFLCTFTTEEVQFNVFECFFWLSPRPISIGQLYASQRLHLRPIYPVVFRGAYLNKVGYLFLRFVSRLDAFSVYQIRTSLPSCATGVTTDAPEVRPFRSSRTRNSSLQNSFAHDG